MDGSNRLLDPTELVVSSKAECPIIARNFVEIELRNRFRYRYASSRTYNIIYAKRLFQRGSPVHSNPSNYALTRGRSWRVTLPYFALLSVLFASLFLNGCAGGSLDPDALHQDIDDPALDAGDTGQDALGADVIVDLDTHRPEDAEDTNPAADAGPDAVDPTPDIVDPGDEDITNPPDTQQPDVTVDDCPDGCALGMVCHEQQCVSVCEVQAIECGPVQIDGGNTHCGDCVGAGEVCEAGQCVVDLCAQNAAECGEISWAGSTEQCGICPSTSDTCVDNRCAQVGYHRVAAGSQHTCATRSTGRVECWGNGSVGGELGNGTNATSTTPVQVNMLSTARHIDAGAHHSCALERSGRAWCWGLNTVGQLGNNSTTSQNVPVQATAYTDIVDIAAGRSHSCIVRANGQVGCFGLGAQGQLGNGGTNNSRLPVGATGIITAEQVALGDYFSCARLENNTVSCWGAPPGNPAGSATPQTIKNGERSTLTDVVDIAAGKEHACAVLNSGEIWCWGKGNNGQLGHGGPDGSTIAKRVPITWRARQIAAGDAHTCAVSTANELYCWGANARGQVGNGSTANQLSPTRLSGFTNALHVSAGAEHTCATKLDGSTWCWGYNSGGQLGDGTTTQRTTPVRVP